MKWEYEDDSVAIMGYYDDGDPKVHIAGNLAKAEAEVVYYHERQHKICYETKCKCWKRKTDYLSEYHAFIAELRCVVARDSKLLTRAYFKCTSLSCVIFKKDPKIWKNHIRALRRVMKTKMFKELKRKAGRK